MGKSGPGRASLFTGEERSYLDSGLLGENAPHPRRTAHRAVPGARCPQTLAWRKCLLLPATPKARVPGAARRGLRAGPASSAPSRGPAGGSALLANGRRAPAPSLAREEPPRSCATCGAWAPDPRPPPRPREARRDRVRKRGLAWAPGPALGRTSPPGAHSSATHLAAGLHGRAAIEALSCAGCETGKRAVL